MSRLHFEDLNWLRRRYNAWAAYGESKLANMLFVSELARRNRSAYLSDPGMTATSITDHGSAGLRWAGKEIAHRIAQTPAQGARSTIQAISTDLSSGAYIAPRGPFHQWGIPSVVRPVAKAVDPASAQRLWEMSVELTGCDW
jgi:NAD(P)-dependent dehydrogenase (short-subunit alcohol dehydrogenase family)